MATTTDDKIYASFPIVKWEDTPEGLVVYGKATDGSVDSDEQIVDPEWSGGALQKWLATGGNVRVQHNPKLYPAGVGLKVEVNRDGDQAHWVKSLVVEDTAQKLVKAKALQAYSVGIMRPTIKRDVAGKAKGGIIADGEIFEVSLVDRPANKNCQITLVKSEGAGGDWETGDLDALLAAATEDVAKAAKPGDAADADSEGGADRTDDAASQEGDDESEAEDAADTKKPPADAKKAAWDAERAEWLGREPNLGSAPANPTEFLVKRAAWQRWQTEGADAGYEDYAVWLAKAGGKKPPVGEGDETPEGAETAQEGEEKPPASKADDDDAAEKGSGKSCAKCGKSYHADSKQRNCEKCGADLPHAEKSEDAPADAGAVKGAGVPYGTHRMHDGLCAAYSWDAVRAEYPSVKGLAEIIEEALFSEWTREAIDKGDMAEVAALAGDASSAQALAKGAVDPALLADARALVHKSFTDLYPNAHCTPGAAPTAGSFRRSYISSGHAPLSARGSGPRLPASNHTPDPGQFQRGALTAGHAAPSPSNKGNNLQADTSTSGAVHVYYDRAAREAVANAIKSLHDRLAESYPDLCPMSAKSTVVPGDMRDTSVPTPVTPPAVPNGPGGLKSDDPTEQVTKAAEPTEVAGTPEAAAVDYSALIEEAVTKAVAGVRSEYEEKIATLSKAVDELGSQPDPTLAPVRGVVRKAPAEGGAAPVERVSLAAKAQADQQAAQHNAEYAAYLRRVADPIHGNPNPQIRDQAEATLQKLMS